MLRTPAMAQSCQPTRLLTRDLTARLSPRNHSPSAFSLSGAHSLLARLLPYPFRVGLCLVLHVVRFGARRFDQQSVPHRRG